MKKDLLECAQAVLVWRVGCWWPLSDIREPDPRHVDSTVWGRCGIGGKRYTSSHTTWKKSRISWKFAIEQKTFYLHQMGDLWQREALLKQADTDRFPPKSSWLTLHFSSADATEKNLHIHNNFLIILKM